MFILSNQGLRAKKGPQSSKLFSVSSSTVYVLPPKSYVLPAERALASDALLSLLQPSRPRAARHAREAVVARAQHDERGGIL